ncbi:clumping factor A-like [Ostrinia nubilalis]|uniref:clumping factor A-like n=1 Tax=Ostrinia nubilalis TaxID=29057 RepID=UPI0030824C2C
MGDSCYCTKQCETKFTEAERIEIFNNFWGLGSNEKRWLFIVNHSKKMLKNRSKQRDSNYSSRGGLAEDGDSGASSSTDSMSDQSSSSDKGKKHFNYPLSHELAEVDDSDASSSTDSMSDQSSSSDKGKKPEENTTMNLIISEVHTQANDNFSDDDVIEVVRDEAPIEILSDGEENEREKNNQSQDTDIQDFHFTSVPTILETQNDQSIDTTVDPLLSNTGFVSSEHEAHDKSPIKSDAMVDETPTNNTINGNKDTADLTYSNNDKDNFERDSEQSVDPLSEKSLKQLQEVQDLEKTSEEKANND